MNKEIWNTSYLAETQDEVADHQVRFTPDPDCYNCRGTGKSLVPSSKSTECDCRWFCDNHEEICIPESNRS